MQRGRNAQRNKFANKRVNDSGYSFASRLERALFHILKAREAAGEIRDIKVQASVHLTKARLLYKPDFSAVDTKTDKLFYVEAKGFMTPEFKLKRRLWEQYGPSHLEVWTGHYLNPKLSEIIYIDDNECCCECHK